jgi:hypothetical protein
VLQGLKAKKVKEDKQIFGSGLTFDQKKRCVTAGNLADMNKMMARAYLPESESLDLDMIYEGTSKFGCELALNLLQLFSALAINIFPYVERLNVFYIDKQWKEIKGMVNGFYEIFGGSAHIVNEILTTKGPVRKIFMEEFIETLNEFTGYNDRKEAEVSAER